MDIEKALEQIRWRVQQRNTPRDIEAFNCIVEWVDEQSKAQTKEYNMFAKMLVVYIMQHARAGNRPLQVILREVEEHLQTPLISLIELMKLETPMYAFELIAHKGTEGLDPMKDFEQIKKIRLSNLKQNEQALVKALKTDWSVDQAIRFVEKQVAKFVVTYNERK